MACVRHEKPDEEEERFDCLDVFRQKAYKLYMFTGIGTGVNEEKDSENGDDVDDDDSDAKEGSLNDEDSSVGDEGDDSESEDNDDSVDDENDETEIGSRKRRRRAASKAKSASKASTKSATKQASKSATKQASKSVKTSKQSSRGSMKHEESREYEDTVISLCAEVEIAWRCVETSLQGLGQRNRQVALMIVQSIKLIIEDKCKRKILVIMSFF